MSSAEPSSGSALPADAATAALRRLAATMATTVRDTHDGVLQAMAAVLAADLGDHACVWLLSPDGARMRTAAVAGTHPANDVIPDGAWVPVDGPVSEVLVARKAVDMGVAAPAEDELRPPLGPADADPGWAFGRYVPIRTDATITGVVGVVRRSGRPRFSEAERVALDVAVERLQAGLHIRALADEVASERGRRMTEVDGVLLTRALLEDLSGIAGDVLLRHRFALGTDYISPGTERASGHTPDEFRADAGLLRRLIHPEDRHLLDELRHDASLREPILVRMIASHGEQSWQYLRLVPITDEAQRVIGVEGIATDVTPLKRAEEAAARLARIDPLTQLANRTTFHDFAGRALARLRRHPGMVGVLFIDMDGFKRINDTFGHQGGDEVLREVARRLSEVVRREDVVARLGGDEFAVLLTQMGGPAEARITAERLLARLEEPVAIRGASTVVSAAIGIAVTESGDLTPEELIERADSAQYGAKRGGGAQWESYGETVEREPDAGMEAAPDAAPEAAPPATDAPDVPAPTRAPVEVRFVPEIDAHDGGIERLELAAPADADEHLVAVGQAAQAVAGWRARFGADIGLTVNAPGSAVATTAFAVDVLDAVRTAGLEAGALAIDIPESVLGNPSPVIDENLRAFREAGVALAIDRFGRGTPSLADINRVRPSLFKIDATLAAELDQPGGDAARERVGLAVRLAASMGARVAVEGVNRSGQLVAARALGARVFQGALGGRPLDVATIERLLDRVRRADPSGRASLAWRDPNERRS